MDPDQALADFHVALAEARAANTQGEQQYLMAEAIQAMEALDEWMTKGGFPPVAWTGHMLDDN